MNLSITIDYELWGNGSGDIFTEVIDTTESLLNICNKRNIKTTIFFEVIEYWKLEQEWISGISMGYINNPALAMKNQIQQAVKDGHDVQLHIHPQWINAKYVDRAWQVDNNYWRLSDVPLNANAVCSMGLLDIIGKGKNTLEEILKPVKPDYKCNIIRAGGYNILPSDNVLRVLKEFDFEMDSSVYSGGYEDGSLSSYDYRKIDSRKAYWFADDKDIREEGNSNVIELLIFSNSVRRFMKYSFQRLIDGFKNRKRTLTVVKNKTKKKSKLDKIKYLLETEYVTYDFCLLSKRQLRGFHKYAKKVIKNSNNAFHPIVLIGHSKSFHYPEVLEYFIKMVKKDNAKFHTLSEINNIIRSDKK
jgi:peptidoglycan/xylan/chitin deacetylase (PgdA/CDA1 family)